MQYADRTSLVLSRVFEIRVVYSMAMTEQNAASLQRLVTVYQSDQLSQRGMPENRRTPQDTAEHRRTPQDTTEHRRTPL